jgi:hypothetical protein
LVVYSSQLYWQAVAVVGSNNCMKIAWT